jgi:hypothetical protein
MNVTLPILSPPSPIKLTHDQIEIKREEIKKILNETIDENNDKDNKKIPSSSSTQSTPFSSGTIITPISRLSFTQQCEEQNISIMNKN